MLKIVDPSTTASTKSLQSLTLEWIVYYFPSLEALETVGQARHLKTNNGPKATIRICSPPPSATKTLRSLRMNQVDVLLASYFVPHFNNLRKLDLSAKNSKQGFDLCSLSSSLPLLTDLSLGNFTVKNSESLKSLVHLSALEFHGCHMPDSLSFLTKGTLPQLTSLVVRHCDGLSTSSFASLVHASNLQVLEVSQSDFDNDCLQYLENMVHLRKLNLSRSKITGDSRSLKTLMQQLFQLENLNLERCRIGNQGAIAEALYSIHSRLRVLNLNRCNLVDDDLNGISVLKNTLEVLNLDFNVELTNKTLVHCGQLVRLKVLRLTGVGIHDLLPLQDCLNLEDLDVDGCKGLTDDSFKVFSEEPNSFPNLLVLFLPFGGKLTEKVLEHLANNNNLFYQLKKLDVGGMHEILLSSATARDILCQLKGLRKLEGILPLLDPSTGIILELMQRLKNLEEIY